MLQMQSSGSGLGHNSVSQWDVMIKQKMLNYFSVVASLPKILHSQLPLTLAFVTEVTLQFLDAGTYELICSLTAEGDGRTETDEVRKAIQKCLDAIFK